MAAKTRYIVRLEKACAYAKIKYPEELIKTLKKRASSDMELNNIMRSIITPLEPPSCTMSHCGRQTVYGFCNCADHMIPGRCAKNLEYLKDKREREEAFATEMQEYYGVDYVPDKMALFEKTMQQLRGWNNAKGVWKEFKELYPVYDEKNSHFLFEKK